MDENSQSALHSSTPATGAGALVGGGRVGELDLFSFILLLRRHIGRIFLFALVGFLVMATYTLMVRPRYAAFSTVIVPRVNPAAAGLSLQSIGGLDLLGGGFEIYIDILRSRTVADALTQDLDLLHEWKLTDKAQAEGLLARKTTFAASPEGLLTVVVEDETPALAARIANRYFVELEQLNQRLAISAAAQQRKYYEQQMTEQKNELADAEVALEQSQEKSGVLEPAIQAQANIGATEATRAQLRQRQVELDAALQGETEQNPNVLRLKAEISGLAGQLQALQSGGGLATGTPSNQAPAQALAHIRAQREIRFHESLFDSLQRGYELSKEQEAKDYSQIKILDTAEVPRIKTWPPRTQYSLLGFFGGAVIGIFLTLMQALLQTIMRNPSNRERYDTLLKGRRA